MPNTDIQIRHALKDYSHLDLTTHMTVTRNNSRQIGGGGFSDVFRAEMHKDWRPRNDPYLQILLESTISLNSTPVPTRRNRIKKRTLVVWWWP